MVKKTKSRCQACFKNKQVPHFVYSALIRILFVFIILDLSGVPALAQSLGIGYGKYMGGDFRGAEAALSAATTTKVSASEKSKIYKYLGISQFMLDKKSQAGTSFQTAVSLNPGITIEVNEVLDESVLPYFEKIKASTLQSRSNKSSTSARAPRRQGTTLLVKSNASGTILIDGIMAGATGEILNVPPGVVELTISAKGYISKRAKVRVIENRDNSVEINLSKPQPKPKPKPVPQPSLADRSAPAEKNPQPQRRAPAQRRGPYLPDPGVELLNDQGIGGRDLASEFSSDAAGASNPQYGLVQPGYGQPAYPPQPVYPPSPGYPMQPAYPQQPYGYPPVQPYPPQPMYPAYPQPQPYYPPQPQMPQPAMPAPIPVDPGPTLPPPVAEPLPPVDFFEDPPAEEKVFDDEFLDSGPQKKKKRKQRGKNVKKKRNDISAPIRIPKNARGKKKRQNKRARSNASSGPDSTDYIINVLPFGAGQFNNGSYILGGLFLAAEVGALYYYYDNKTKADDAVARAEAYFASPNYTAQQKQEFEEETRTYVNDKRQQQSLGLYSFVGLYLVGVGEAFLNMPSAAPKAKRKTKRPRRASIPPNSPLVESVLASAGSDPSIDADLDAGEGLVESFDHRKYVSPLALSFGIMWDGEEAFRQTNAPEPKFGFKLDWTF